ncbi:MAG: hypothetical protein WCP28_04535 [Actinomycetes bacterium]
MAPSSRPTTPQTLHAILAAGRHFSAAGAARLCAAIATALASEHQAGRVQGGLDPMHILVYPLGAVELLPWESEVVGGATSSSDVAVLMALAGDLIRDAPVPASFARFVMGEQPDSAAQAATEFLRFVTMDDRTDESTPVPESPAVQVDSDTTSERARQSPQAVRTHRQTSHSPDSATRPQSSRWLSSTSRPSWVSRLTARFSPRPSWCSWRLAAACGVLLVAIGAFLVPAVHPQPVVATPQDQALPTPEPAQPSQTGPADWQSVLASLDAQRAQAFSEGSPDRLTAVYVPGSAAEVRDRELMNDLVAMRAKTRGLRNTIVSLSIVTATDNDAKLAVSDKRDAYQIVAVSDGKVLQSRPARAQQIWIIELTKSGSGWRVATVAAAPT